MGKNNKTFDSISSLVESENFAKMNTDVQEKLIAALDKESNKSSGIIGKILGTSTANLSIHAILLLCFPLLALILIDNLHAYQSGTDINMDLIGTIIPVITLAIGYIIGKGSKNNL